MLKKVVIFLLTIILLAPIALAAKTINLPAPSYKGKYSVEETIVWRRSIRDYQNTNLSLQQISQLLWSAQGITDSEFGFRAAPSAGALYPLTLYLLTKDGLFRYIPDGHKLVEISSEDKWPMLVRASLGQSFLREAPADIVIAGNFRITEAKYGARAYRYVLMEIGHVAENIHLQAISLGLSSIAVGAFWDNVVKKNLELPDNHDPLYIIPIGYHKV